MSKLIAELDFIDNVSPALPKIDAKLSDTMKKSMETKRQVERDARDMQRIAMRAVSGIRLMFTAFGGAIDPFMSAVLNIFASAVETLVALAAAEGSTILGMPAAAVHGALALSIQIAILPGIMAGLDEAKEFNTRATAALDAIAIFGGV